MALAEIPSSNRQGHGLELWGVPGRVYRLMTDQLVIDGTRAYRLLKKKGIQVLGGGGVRADRHLGPHVDFVVGEVLPHEINDRLRKLGMPLTSSELEI